MRPVSQGSGALPSLRLCGQKCTFQHHTEPGSRLGPTCLELNTLSEDPTTQFAGFVRGTPRKILLGQEVGERKEGSVIFWLNFLVEFSVC